MIIEHKILVGYQLGEFKAASRLRNWQILAQFTTAIPPAISVFTDDHVVLYYLALAGGLSLLIWAALELLYTSHREPAEAARRLTLIRDGLGERVSQEEEFLLKTEFKIPSKIAAANATDTYFASRSRPGPQRLCELIEESSFWTERMQRDSAVFMSFAFILLVTIFASAFWLTLPISQVDTQITVARLFLALSVFLLSSDVWGAVSGHCRAWLAVRDIFRRCSGIAARRYQLGDVLLLMADYNAAVEAAPLSVPLVYDYRKAALNSLWDAYLRSHDGVQANP